MKHFKFAALALLALFFLPTQAEARFAGPQQFAVKSAEQKVFFGQKGKMYKYHKFHKHMKPKAGTSGTNSSNPWGGYVAGATVCMVAWPMINAALGNPEPTSQQMLQHVAGCWIPPLAIIQFLQSQGAL